MTMLAGIDFTQRISKKKFKKQLPGLNERLYCLQKASWDASLPIIVLLEGWETVPKGGLIRTLTEPLDPRGFVFHAIRSPQADEKNRPWMWRFWLRIPERGQWAIFDQSWYRRVLVARQQDKISERDLRRAFRDINSFERTLHDDGALILKFFLHTTKSEFKLKASPAARATDADPPSLIDPKTSARLYDQWLAIYEDALRHTQQDWAPWITIPADDKQTARYLLLKTIVKRIQQQLGDLCKPKRSPTKAARPEVKEESPHPAPVPIPADDRTQPAIAIDAQELETPAADENTPQTELETPALSSDTTPPTLPGEPEEPDGDPSSTVPVSSS